MNDGNKITRVYCLYRVSTKGQVDHDDIPVQKKAAHDYVDSRKGWQIIREEKELGVSGSKVSAAKRDVIQDYLEDAKQGKFDVLLVFMFDRLGRIEDETPFVLEAFVKAGVECWSVCEGQQKIENHTDKLMNYIRFWQAAGETYKMAQRIGETHSQIVESGHFRGGYIPFGYKAVDMGRRNKKDLPLLDLQIDPVNAPIAKELFHKTVYEGYGSYQLVEWLKSKGVKHNTGADFSHNTVLRILRNPIYTGYYVTKKTRSPHLPDLQLVEFDVFSKVVEILHDRSRQNETKRKTALRTQAHNLLSGNIYCGHCGNRLSSAKWQDKKRRKDGSLYIGEAKYKYSCFYKSQKRVECDGQNTYDSETIEHIVVETTRSILRNFKQMPKDISIEWRVEKRIAELQKAAKEILQKLKRQQEQLTTLQAEVGKCLLGQSRFTQDILADAIEAAKLEIDQTYLAQSEINTELENQTLTKESINRYYDEFDSWVDEFDKATHERKRMILSELYDRIEVRRHYEITVYLNPNYKQFLASDDEENFKMSDAV